MSLKSHFGEVFVCLFLAASAMFSAQFRHEDIEKLLKLHNETVVQQVMRTEEDESPYDA